MTKHYFLAGNTDLSTIQKRLVFWFKEREYEIDYTEAEGVYLIQAKKSSKLRTLTGTNIAFKIKLYWSNEPDMPGEFIFESSTGKWVSNLTGAGVSALFTGGITILTGIAGAAWTNLIESEIIEYMEDALKFRKTKTLSDTTNNQAEFSTKPSSETALNMPPVSASSPRDKAMQKVQQELVKINDAFNNGILTADEFNTKKLALENKVDEYEIDFAVEQQSIKLKQALEQGILEQEEYQNKLMSLRDNIQQKIVKEQEEQAKTDKIAKLKVAFNNGILSQDEFDAKIAVLQY